MFWPQWLAHVLTFYLRGIVHTFLDVQNGAWIPAHPTRQHSSMVFWSMNWLSRWTLVFLLFQLHFVLSSTTSVTTYISIVWYSFDCLQIFIPRPHTQECVTLPSWQVSNKYVLKEQTNKWINRCSLEAEGSPPPFLHTVLISMSLGGCFTVVLSWWRVSS